MNRSSLPSNFSHWNAAEPRNADNDYIDLNFLLSAARRRLKVVVVWAMLGLVLGAVYLATTPKTYVAWSTVLMDDSAQEMTSDISPVKSDMLSEASILGQIEVIKSANLAADVAQRLNLYQSSRFLNPPSSLLAQGIGLIRLAKQTAQQTLMGLISISEPEPEANRIDQAAAQVESLRAGVETALRRGLYANRIGRSNALAIGYSSYDPHQAMSIANAYAETFLEDQLAATYEATEKGIEWLDKRLIELRENSQEAALTVERFREQNNLTSADGELISNRQVSDLSRTLFEAQADTAVADAQYEQLQSIVSQGADVDIADVPIPQDVAPDAPLSVIKSRYLELTRRENDILGRFGSDHPELAAVRAAKAKQADLFRSELQQLAERYRNQLRVAETREESLRRRIQTASSQNSDARQVEVQLKELEQRAQTLNALYESFLDRYQKLEQRQSFPVHSARIISKAELPRSATSPRTIPTLGILLILGATIGGVFGALAEWRERYFRTSEDVTERLGMKFLGYLPLVKRSRQSRRRELVFPEDQPADASRRRIRRRFGLGAQVVLDSPLSLFSETLRNVKIANNLASHGASSTIIGVLSALPDEGKSTVAANLGLLLASSGYKTLLIDADIRNPGLTAGLGLDAPNNLIDTVSDPSIDWQDQVRTDGKSGLFVLPTSQSKRSALSSEALSSDGMRKLLESARAHYQFVIVDLPPIGLVVDAKAFAPLTDSLVFVTEWGRTPRAVVKSIFSSDSQLAGKLLGVLINKVEMSALAKYSSFGTADQYLNEYAVKGYYEKLGTARS